MKFNIKRKKLFQLGIILTFAMTIICNTIVPQYNLDKSVDPRYAVYEDWIGLRDGDFPEDISVACMWQDIQATYPTIVNGGLNYFGEVQTMSSPDTVTYYTGSIEAALNAGYLLDHLQWFYDTGSIPASFVPSSQSTQTATDSGTTDSGTTDSGSTGASTGSGTSSGKSTTSSTKSDTSASKKVEVTEDTSVAGDYVTTDDAAVYSDYNGKATKETITNGSDVSVEAKTSNGYYKTKYNDDTAYIKESEAATKEDYEAAWEETDRVEATCTEDGKVVYTNSLSGLTKEESIPKLEHDYVSESKTEATCTEDGEEVFKCSVCGDEKTEVIEATGHTPGEWQTVKKAGLLTKGEKQKVCETCGEVLESKNIKSIVPVWVAVAAVIALVGGGAGVGYAVYRKRKQTATL